MVPQKSETKHQPGSAHLLCRGKTQDLSPVLHQKSPRAHSLGPNCMGLIKPPGLKLPCFFSNPRCFYVFLGCNGCKTTLTFNYQIKIGKSGICLEIYTVSTNSCPCVEQFEGYWRFGHVPDHDFCAKASCVSSTFIFSSRTNIIIF